jgi:hypothetical protein
MVCGDTNHVNNLCKGLKPLQRLNKFIKNYKILETCSLIFSNSSFISTTKR